MLPCRIAVPLCKSVRVTPGGSAPTSVMVVPAFWFVVMVMLQELTPLVGAWQFSQFGLVNCGTTSTLIVNVNGVLVNPLVASVSEVGKDPPICGGVPLRTALRPRLVRVSHAGRPVADQLGAAR